MTLPDSHRTEVSGASAASLSDEPQLASTLQGREWIIDAHGCDPTALTDGVRLRALVDRIVQELALTPVVPPVWHTFPPPGGVTGFVVLAESHLACHTFPEFGSICVNVFCCRPRPDIDAARLLAETLGATHTLVRCVERTYVRSHHEGA
jgi:S-adenosylmethionine decarboxylase